MENYFQIQNNLWVHKGIAPDQYDKRPYYEFQLLVETWAKWLEKQKEENAAMEARQKAEEAKYDPSNYKMPNMGDMKIPD